MFAASDTPAKARRSPFAGSLLLHAAAAAILLSVEFAPAVLHTVAAPVVLVAPNLSDPKPPPVVVMKRPAIIAPAMPRPFTLPEPVTRAAAPLSLPRAEIQLPKTSAPQLAAAPSLPSPPVPAAPKAIIPQAVATGVFAGDSPPVPSTRVPKTVEPAGFHPRALTTLEPSQRSAPARLSGFETTGEVRKQDRTGQRAAAAGTAFGEVQSNAGPVRTSGGQTLQAGGFGTARIADEDRRTRVAVQGGGFGAVTSSTAQAASQPKPEPGQPISKPVRILHKPRPEYTDAARALQIEGAVSLRVLFTAAGEVKVVGVIQGLPHGLDENAIRAASGIRFEPAESGGRPVDSTAIVHISFQLAF